MTETKTIAYQGEPGANSHIACLDNYPGYAPLPCATFEDAFAALQEGKADLGMIPIENSIAGRVADIHALLARLRPAYRRRDLRCRFIFSFSAFPARRSKACAASTATSTRSANAARSSAATRLKPMIAGDTAGSAREVAEWRDPSRASLATGLAGEIYGLTTLAADVEDETHNTTRFVVLSKTPRWAAAHNGPLVTTFVFRVRNVPAALYKALGGFATNGVNMTKLESYMVEGEFSATQFLADVDGHPDDPPLARALEELEFFSREMRILGVYPAHPFRVETQRGAE